MNTLFDLNFEKGEAVHIVTLEVQKTLIYLDLFKDLFLAKRDGFESYDEIYHFCFYDTEEKKKVLLVYQKNDAKFFINTINKTKDSKEESYFYSINPYSSFNFYDEQTSKVAFKTCMAAITRPNYRNVGPTQKESLEMLEQELEEEEKNNDK